MKERPTIDSAKIGTIEINPEDKLTHISDILVNQVFEIPGGAFSGIATYDEDGQEKRISPILDELMAENFTNWRYVVREINAGRITSKDPRERYEGDIDEVIKRTKKDFDRYKDSLVGVEQDLEARRDSAEISDDGYTKAMSVLSNTHKVYKLLQAELEAKRRGYDSLGHGEVSIVDGYTQNKANMLLEIKYLPGGQIVILRGYVHSDMFQEEYGDLFKEYSIADYIAIEGYANCLFGESLYRRWERSGDSGYSHLMRGLVTNGFNGQFIELDSRYIGRDYENDFDSEFGFDDGRFYSIVRGEVIEGLYTYYRQMRGSNAKIKSKDQFSKVFRLQMTEQRESRMDRDGANFIKDGTYYKIPLSVSSNLDTSAEPTGYEYGQTIFADALSVLKVLILNKAMNDGDIAPGLLVDFQGVGHLSFKSYFFDHPQYAMEVVLANMHELLTSYPGLKNVKDVVAKLNNMDTETWRWVFIFLGAIPLARVADPKLIKRSVNPGVRHIFQRPMVKEDGYIATRHFTPKQKEALDNAITLLLQEQ